MIEPNCERCPLKGQPRVYGEGSRVTYTERQVKDETTGITKIYKQANRDNTGEYPIVVIGMAPAEEEVRQGRVLVGPSGQVLRGALNTLGMKDYYLMNIFLCPLIVELGAKEAIDLEWERIVEEIKARNPKLIIALGDLPFKVLTDLDYGIKQVEGRIVPSKLGISLLPLAHPAYYLRNPDEAFDFVECSRSGLKFFTGKYQQAVEPTREVVTSENLSRVLNEIDKHEWIAVDTETTGFSAYGWEPDHLLEMGISTGHEHCYIVPAEIIPEFKGILETKKGIYWNAQFDAAFLRQIGINPRIEFDGMLAHYTIDERPYSHGLKKVARVYLGCENWEERLDEFIPKRQKKSVSYEVVPREIRYEYLAKDVTRTFHLKEVLEEDINKEVFYDILMPACRVFIDLEYNGIRVNPMKLMNMSNVLEEDLGVLEKEINELAGTYLTPTSPQQVMEYFFDKLKIPIDSNYGRTSSKAFLSGLGIPIADKIVEYREMAKMKGTYLVGLAKFADKSFRIHPSFKLFSAVTGRVHTENPSMMNIKRNSRLREIWIPEEGQVMASFDWKQLELKWYLCYYPDPILIDIFKKEPTEDNPRANDPHYIASRVAFGEELADKLRTDAKTVVFGILYGRGYPSVELQVGPQRAGPLWKTVTNLFPNLPKYKAQILKELSQKGYVTSFFGRKRRFPLITWKNRKEVERQAVNMPIQSAASDLNLLTLLHLYKERERLQITPHWTIHDSIEMSIPSPNLLPKVAKEIEEFANDLVHPPIPFETEYKWGLDWSMRKE